MNGFERPSVAPSEESAEDRVQRLEQLIGHAAISDREAAAQAANLGDEERADLGEYIGRAVRGGTHPRTFYACWDVLDQSLRSEFIERFTVDEPEAAAMVAPFVDLTKIRVSVKKRTEPDGAEDSAIASEAVDLKKVERKKKALHRELKKLSWNPSAHDIYWRRARLEEIYASLAELESVNGYELKGILEARFGSFVNAKELVEAYLDNPVRGDDGKSSAHFLGLIRHYAESRSSAGFILPYLPRLVESGLIDAYEAEDLMTKNIDNGDFAEKFYLTDAERKRSDEIRSLESKRQGEKEEYLHLRAYDMSEDIGAEYEAIQSAARSRGGAHVFRAYKDYRRFADKPDSELLVKMADRSFPVLESIELLGLEPAEVESLCVKSDEAGALIFFGYGPDVIVSLLKSGNEKTFMRYLTEDLKGDSHNGLDIAFVSHLEKILPLMSSENSEKALNLLNREAPTLWLLRWDYVLAHRPIPLRKLLEEAAADDWIYLNNYSKISFHLARAGARDREAVADIRSARQTVLEIFERDPARFIRFPKVAESVFSPEEADAFVRRNLVAPVDPDFLFDLLESPMGKSYLAECRAILAEAPELTAIAGLTERRMLDLKAVLGQDEAFGTLVDQAGRVSWNAPFRDKEFFLYLHEHPLEFERLIKGLQDSERLNLLANLKNIAHSWTFRSTHKKASIAERKFIEAAADVRVQALATLKKACEERTAFVFAEGVMEALGSEAAPYVERGIDAYAEAEPRAAVRAASHGALSNDHFERIFRRHARELLFTGGEFGRKTWDEINIPANLIEETCATNPFAQVKLRGTDGAEFHAAVLKRIESNPFYGLYSDRLKEMAKEEVDARGPQTTTPKNGVRKDFEETVRRVVLLGLSPAAVSNRRELSELPPDRREELLSMLEIISLHGLDDGLVFDLKSESAEEVRSKLASRIVAYMSRPFEIEDLPRAEGLVGLPLDVMHAMTIYYRQRCRPDSEMREVFRDVFRSVADETYAERRAWGESGVGPEDRPARLEAMKAEGVLPSGLTLEAYDRWLDDDETGFEAVLDFKFSDVLRGTKDILSQAVLDGHLPKDELEMDEQEARSRYSILAEPIAALSHRRRELREIVWAEKGKRRKLTAEEESEYREIRSGIAGYLSENGAALLKARGAVLLNRFKQASAKELEDQILIIGKQRLTFKDAFKALEDAYGAEFPDFYQDIQRLRSVLREGRERMFGGARVSKSNLTVTDKLDFATYLMIGERPVPSCQNYDSDSDLNSGLLSYISDPNVKFIQIYDDSGRLMTRCAMRLLEDEDGNPQMFLERVYSQNSHDKISEAVVNFAKSKAAAMGIGLFSSESQRIVGYEGPSSRQRTDLKSKGSRAPYVYTDAGGGKKRDGRYVVKGAYRIS